MDVLDIWVNLVTESPRPTFLGQDENAHIPGYLGSDGSAGSASTDSLGVMDELGVATGVFTAGIDRDTDKLARSVPTRTGPFPRRRRRRRPRPAGTRRAAHPGARGAPGFAWCASCRSRRRSRRTTPATIPCTRCARSSGSRSASTSGIPGPRVRSRVQHPELLEDVLIDFPDLVVIVAHMGHPYEELLMNYMRKWPNLYVSCTAYAPRYMDPDARRVHEHARPTAAACIWGSDEPWFPMRRSLAEARDLPLDDDAMAQFLGGTARRLLDRAAT